MWLDVEVGGDGGTSLMQVNKEMADGPHAVPMGVLTIQAYVPGGPFVMQGFICRNQGFGFDLVGGVFVENSVQ